MKHNYRVSESIKAEAISSYANGESMSVIAQRIGVDQSTVRAWFVARGIPRRSRIDAARQHYGTTTDESAFDSLGSECVDYWCGFLAADGAIFGDTVALVLAHKDAGHLELFRQFVHSSQKVVVLPDGLRAAINSRRIVSTLERYGITQRKSHTMTACEGLLKSRHYWRGVMDGDGHLGKTRGKPRIDLCGSEPHMRQFLAFVAHSGVTTAASVRPMKSIFRVQLVGAPAKQVVELLYTGASVVLERKAKVAALIANYNGARGIYLRALVDTPTQATSLGAMVGVS